MFSSFTDRNVFNTRRYPVIDQDTIQVLDRATGKAVDSWGANLYSILIFQAFFDSTLNEHVCSRFYMPHGLKVDAAGNVWVTDVALHQVGGSLFPYAFEMFAQIYSTKTKSILWHFRFSSSRRTTSCSRCSKSARSWCQATTGHICVNRPT